MNPVCGLITRRVRWGLTWRGWLALGLAAVTAAAAAAPGIYSYLAVTDRIDADILVVEGWVQGYAIQAGAEEFHIGNYRRILTTGGPVSGAYTTLFNTSAHVGAESLQAMGIDRALIEAVPASSNGRDRTYHAALALREALGRIDPPVRAINIVTENVHARRSRLLYKRVLGRDVRVGVIAVPDPDVDPDRWWQFSEGVKDVISEGAAWLHATFLFRPESPP